MSDKYFDEGYRDAFYGKDRSEYYEEEVKDYYLEGREAFYQDYYEGLVLSDETTINTRH